MSNLTGKVSIYQRISESKVTHRSVAKYDEKYNPIEFKNVTYDNDDGAGRYTALRHIESLLETGGDENILSRFRTGEDFDNLVLEEKYIAIDPAIFQGPEKERIDGTKRHMANSKLYVVSGFDWNLLKSGPEFAEENLAAFKRLYPALGRTEVNLFGYDNISKSYINVPSPLKYNKSTKTSIESLFTNDEIKERYKCDGIVSQVNYKEPDSNDYMMWSGISFNLSIPSEEDANKEIILFEVQQTKFVTNDDNTGNKEFVTRAFRIVFDDGKPFTFADMIPLPESLYSDDDYKILFAEEPDLFFIVNIFFNNKITFETIDTEDYSLNLVYHNTLKDNLFPDGIARSDSYISTVTDATIRYQGYRLSVNGSNTINGNRITYTGKIESEIRSTKAEYMPLIGLLDNITDKNKHIALLLYPNLQEDLAGNGTMKRYSLLYPGITEQDKLLSNPIDSLAPQSFIRRKVYAEDIRFVYIDDSNTKIGHKEATIEPSGLIFPVEFVHSTLNSHQRFLNEVDDLQGYYEYDINQTDNIASSYGIVSKRPCNFVTQVVNHESSAESIEVITTLEGTNTLKKEVEYVFRSPMDNDIHLIPLPYNGRLFYLLYKNPLKVAASQTIIIKVNFYESFF